LEYGICSTKSDVWSFGISIWEMFSYGKLPYAEASNDSARQLIISGRLLDCPEGCPPEIYKIMLSCWIKGSKERPSFKDVQESIGLLMPKQQPKDPKKN